MRNRVKKEYVIPKIDEANVWLDDIVCVSGLVDESHDMLDDSNVDLEL